ncbi:hypothetical protein ANTQUA_LOCUS8945 [Anthophora quadrimaculata]
MQSSYKAIIILFVAVAVCAYEPPQNDPPCNCDYCNDEIKNVKEDDKMHKEDSDGDGNNVICARDREFNDRTFPSVCHMFCYNRCLILRLSTVTVNNTKRYIVNAFRNNYYKLRDGEC